MSTDEIFTGLDQIDWAALRHAYGPADDVPELLCMLISADPAVRELAMDSMYGGVHHQGDVYDSTLAAIPFLLRIVAYPGLPGRADVLRLLASIADAERPDKPVDLDRAPYGQAAAAVADAWRMLMLLLDDPDPLVRQAVGQPLLAHRSGAAEVVAALWQRLSVEPQPDVAAALVKTIGMFAERAADIDTAEVRTGLSQVLAKPGHQRVRLAALGALARCGSEPLSAGDVSLATQLLLEVHSEPRPAPPTPVELVPDAPPTLTGALRNSVEARRDPDDDLDPFGPTPVRDFSWALGDRVGNRVQLLTGLLDRAGRQGRLDVHFAIRDLVAGWRGDYEGLARRLGSDVLDSHPRVAESAVDTLSSLDELAAPAADAVVQALDAMPREVHWENPYLGPQAWVVVKTYDSAPGRVSVDLGKILYPLVALRDVRVLPALRWILERANPPQQIGSVIGDLGPLAADLVPLIRQRLRESLANQEFRDLLVAALGQIGPLAADAVGEIIAMLDNDNSRTMPLVALGRIGPAAVAAIPALRSQLDHPDDERAREAAVALWRITGDADDAVIQAIARGLDGDQYTKPGAALALGTLGPAAASVLPRLRVVLAQADDESDANCWTRFSVATALWHIAGDAEAAVPVLITLWRRNLYLMPDLVRCLAEMGVAARPVASLARAEADSPLRYKVQRIADYTDVFGSSPRDDERLLRDCRRIVANADSA